MSKCRAIKKNGTNCTAKTVEGSIYCGWHQPAMLELRKKAGGIGGRNYRLAPGESTFNWLCLNHRNNAKARGIETKLTNPELRQLFTSDCYYCGEKPKQQVNNTLFTHYGVFLYNGIDRVDNSKGYVIGNVVPCCGVCNKAKQKMNKDEFFLWILRVYNHRIKNHER